MISNCFSHDRLTYWKLLSKPEHHPNVCENFSLMMIVDRLTSFDNFFWDFKKLIFSHLMHTWTAKQLCHYYLFSRLVLSVWAKFWNSHSNLNLSTRPPSILSRGRESTKDGYNRTRCEVFLSFPTCLRILCSVESQFFQDDEPMWGHPEPRAPINKAPSTPPEIQQAMPFIIHEVFLVFCR